MSRPTTPKPAKMFRVVVLAGVSLTATAAASACGGDSTPTPTPSPDAAVGTDAATIPDTSLPPIDARDEALPAIK